MHHGVSKYSVSQKIIRNKESYIGKLNAEVIIRKSIFRESVACGPIYQPILNIEFYTNKIYS